MNTVALIGRLTYKPELKTTQSGLSVLNFQVAVDRQYQSNGERKADFIDCQAWKKTAEFINQYFHKGDQIALTGSIQTDSYTDKDGNKHKSTIVVTNNVSFCGSNKSNHNTENVAQSQQTSYSNNIDFEDDDDLPF